ncbi:MAG: MFS transporter [Gammaproteobacteria bacterium]|nr:MFS transporter [Gammaproteobacteria bacterium]MDH5303225.1 MFS transporter [Gammaproteobacteria bacterium]MDH5323547.1 MFS transporter [Gammaproteobacteria bacterium]
MQTKPQLSFWQIWNMCFGFLGIQFGFALQNANVSRIFQTLGASIDDIPILWVAAPLTGLIVQPIVGYMSDRTWNRLGRRRPYFLVGAVLASLALFVMPNSPALWIAAGMLWIMDASINISMEPFRAFVGDMLPENQRTAGFAMQTFFIGIGAVVASALPYMMSNWFDVSNTAAAGVVPDSVKLSFYWGGAIFLLAVLWTVVRSKEYSPEQLAAFEAARPTAHIVEDVSLRPASRYLNGGLVWAAIGVAFWYWIMSAELDKQLFVLAGGFILFGLLQIATSLLQRKGRTDNGLYHIMHDLFHMPKVMQQLAVVQFFSWFALFAMWIYGTSAVTSHHYGASDATSVVYNDGADWVGVLFAAYNGFAALAAIAIPFVANKLGCRLCHLINMLIGGSGLVSFLFIKDPTMLLIPMIGVGIAWASILSLPYALLSSNLPAHKMGIYMGIFNFFIVIPQLVAASVLGLVLRKFFDLQSIYGLVIGGLLMMIAGFAILFVDKQAEPRSS